MEMGLVVGKEDSDVCMYVWMDGWIGVWGLGFGVKSGCLDGGWVGGLG